MSSSSLKDIASPAIARWIAQSLRLNPPRAKSLVMTVFGDTIAPRGGVVWLGSLIALLSPFGISERLVRTAVYRLADEGWLDALRHGRRSQYRLSAQGEKRFLRAHQRVYASPTKQWEGLWTLVCMASHASSAQKSALKKELVWEGFAPVNAGLFAYPGEKNEALQDLLQRTRTAKVVTVLSASDSGLDNVLPLSAAVSTAWPLKETRATYKKFITRFESLQQLLSEQALIDPEHAFVLRTLLIHDYRRALLTDPNLPAELLESEWPGSKAYALSKAIYKTIERPAEKQLAFILSQEQQNVPAVDARFTQRFR
ncbi:MAG: phenylacetic acid degradation operon negative regulatory protein PaaX [Oxalobacteraceae bacterium]|jgi:phenylacetic acid degradation operon negative regulatory protein|nr:phenylacetic acid degradation operon negative regulatory protein PaaX [Oxalobacteraceae bacterium]